MEPKNVGDENLKEIVHLIRAHEDYRKQTLNLSGSENSASPLVRRCLSSDLGNRYYSEYYGGTKFIQQIKHKVEKLATEVFNCKFASAFPISGHMCDLAAVLGFTNEGDNIAMVSTLVGGYPFNLSIFGRKRVDLPFDDQTQNIDMTKMESFLKDKRPSLVILGASFFLFPYPLQEIYHLCLDQKISMVYDGSHVLGLMAGHEFQNPLDDCSSCLLFGSTHKSFPGPQGGLLLSNSHEMFAQMNELFGMQLNVSLFDPAKGTILIDNPHPHRIAALGAALAEMKAFGDTYAQQMLKNSKVLADSLTALGIDLMCKELGFTKSHHIVIDANAVKKAEMKNELEKYQILIDMGGRISTAEITRRGMKEGECSRIAQLISEVLNKERNPHLIRRDIQELACDFQTIHYTFSELLDLMEYLSD